MRTNYKGLKTILTNLLGEGSIKSFVRTSRGLTVRTNTIGDFRVILVDGRESESEQGIHLRQLANKQELIHALTDSIEQVEKDNWYSIWIHQTPKANPERRKRLVESVNQWMGSKQGASVGAAASRFEGNVSTTLESMTEAQLDLMLKFISGAYQSGANSTREYWSPKYHALRKELEKRGATMDKILELSNTRGA